ncbi:hypothetical protein [Dactylosporangium sp. CS-033363]|uniref:hypothetical protein n=1 Tax=Dactylosporangium sp. CS-033363 TaxID=3239935 RepID=UPI003D8B741B
MREIVLFPDLTGSWIVLDHEDGTGQLIHRSHNAPPGTHVRATRHTLITEVRAAAVEKGLPLDNWPEQ